VEAWQKELKSKSAREAYEIVVRSPRGPLYIGPGKQDAAATLAACIGSFISPR